MDNASGMSESLPTNTTNQSPSSGSSYVESYLQDGEVFQHTVHHILLRQMLELVNEVDHVLAHRGSMDAVNKTTIFKPCILRLPKRRDHSQTRDGCAHQAKFTKSGWKNLIRNILLSSSWKLRTKQSRQEIFLPPLFPPPACQRSTPWWTPGWSCCHCSRT